jgi:hypothetical protein
VRTGRALTADVRFLFSEGTDSATLAPLVDAWEIANNEQRAPMRATVSSVSKEITGKNWGFKDGILRPTDGAGGRPEHTAVDDLRKVVKKRGWKATLEGLYTLAQQDAEAARELLAVVEVLNPKN